MKKIIYILIALFALVVSLFAANPAVMGAGSTIAGLQSVVRGDTGTFIMTDGQAFMLAWPKGTSYAWTVISEVRGIDINGLKTSATTLSKLLLDLEANGFQYVSFDQLPRGITETILGYSVSQLVIAGLRSFPTVYLVPVMMFQPTPTIGVVQ